MDNDTCYAGGKKGRIFTKGTQRRVCGLIQCRVCKNKSGNTTEKVKN